NQDNAAGFQEVAHSDVSGLSVDVKFVVGTDIERTKRPGILRRPFLQIFIEHGLPAGGMDAGGVGNDAVHVEEGGFIAVARDNERVFLTLLRFHAAASLSIDWLYIACDSF